MDAAAGEDRWTVEWRDVAETLRAFEPNATELVRAAPTLAGFYNDRYNRAMMSNTIAFKTAEVVDHVAELQAKGERPFLLERDGVLVGDADFRHLTASEAEFAILVGRRDEQGKGMGTRFATLLHAFAFLGLGLQRLFVSIIPQNEPSQRLFLRLGYSRDDGAAARRFADEESDLTFSLGRAEFESRFANVLPEMRWRRR
jgi:RimJ/RimL family protein N-acetyltransferase